ncbi:MAG: hypothetical protein P8Y66_05070 [Nitrospirota bacterium]
MVAELGKSYAFDVEIIRKPEAGRLGRPSLPKFPAMEIDDELFFEDGGTSVKELERELIRRNAPRA